MDDIYQWLYDHYALPKFADLRTGHDEVLDAFAERARLSKKERLRLNDLVSNMRLQWGTESFAWGVWLGLRLTDPRDRPIDHEWLTYFLP